MPLTWTRCAVSLEACAGAPDFIESRPRANCSLAERRRDRGVNTPNLFPYQHNSAMPRSRPVQTACRMDLYSQARTLGILTQFVDGQGQTRITDEAALKIIIDALPARRERHFVEAPVVIRPGEPAQTELSQSAALPVRWTITAGSRVIGEGEADGRTIRWPQALPSGVYRLRLTDAGAASEDLPLVVAAKAHGGDFDRAWLVAVQLYGVRSARNWGMGDFTDLKNLIELASKLGADGVGLNPLHALFDDRPTDCSPYSPNSRLFLNALYIDVGSDSRTSRRHRPRSALAAAAIRSGRLCRRGRIEMARIAIRLREFQDERQRPAASAVRAIPQRTRRAAFALRLLRGAPPPFQRAVVGMAGGMAAAG